MFWQHLIKFLKNNNKQTGKRWQNTGGFLNHKKKELCCISTQMVVYLPLLISLFCQT
jgi:hypothetical protein